MKEVRTEAKGTGTWEVTREVITPEKAGEMLKHNTKNYRIINRRLVLEYAKAMREGAWEENGEPIVFDEDGVLKNGQHRLLAVIASGVSVRMLVVRGVDRNILVYDEGRKRTPTDHARAAGIAVNNRALTLARYMVGNWDERSRQRCSNYNGLFSYIADNEAMIETALKCAAMSKQASMSSIDWLPGHQIIYLFLRNGYSESKMRQFCTIFNGGLPAQGVESTPAIVASRQYANDRGNRSISFIHEYMANLACALEDFATGKRRTQRYQQGAGAKWTVEKIEALWHKIRQEDGIE